KSSLHASDQLVWSRVLDPAVRVRDPDPQSSVGLVLNPAVRVRDPDPQSSVEPGLGPGCPGQRPGPTKQCGAGLGPGCPGQRPGPTKALVFCGFRNVRRCWQVLTGFRRWRWQRCLAGSLSEFDSSVLVVESQSGQTIANGTAGRRFFIAVVNLQLSEIRLDFAAARARVHSECSLHWQGKLDIATAVIDLNVSQL